MKNLKKIMVGFDVINKKSNVLKRALLMAKENKAELFIVYAVETPWFSMPSYFGGEKITVDIKEMTTKIEKKIKEINKDDKVTYNIVVREGNAEDVLLYESKLLKAELVIIGKNTKDKKKFLGTTAEKVAHQSHLPVLIVKNKVKDTYKNILAPTDFEIQSKQSVSFVKNICHSAKIQAVHIYEPFYPVGMYSVGTYTLETLDIEQYNESALAFAKNNLKEFMQEVDIKKGKVINGGFNSKEVLLQYIKKESYDLIVVGSRGTSGFKALLGSMASSILKETSTDVLIYVP